MIIQEYFEAEDGYKLVKTYSDAGMMIEQDGTGIRYAEAIHPEEMGRTYTETDEPVDREEMEADK